MEHPYVAATLGASVEAVNRRRFRADALANALVKLSTNKEGKVKMFSMGFQDGADMQLLDAIAIMNGGVSAPILAGQSIDFTSQIVEFFSNQIGTVLLSDVNVDVKSGNARVFGETQQTFSLLSSGYEVAVRGLLEVPDSPDNNLELRAVTSAATVQGINEWEAMTLVQGTNGDNDPSKSSLCFQSYAHARVTQLMRLYEASKFIDHDIILELVTLANPDDCDKKEKVDCIKAEALALALGRTSVWRIRSGKVWRLAGRGRGSQVRPRDYAAGTAGAHTHPPRCAYAYALAGTTSSTSISSPSGAPR